MARPLVGHRELDFDRWVLLAELGQTGTHSRQRRFCRQSFAGRPGTSEQRLDLAQLDHVAATAVLIFAL